VPPSDPPFYPANSPADAAREQPRRVLLVDDNLDSLELLADYLRECGHQVATASHPTAALAQAQAFSPEVAVLDIGLPGMDGYELAGRLRDQLGPGCRLIALTGYGQERDRDLSARAGFERHLLKPVDVEALATMIARGNA
jgi:CheY-like chemotaxis protein